MNESPGGWKVLRFPGPRPREAPAPWQRVRGLTWWCAEGDCPEVPDEGSDWCPAHRCVCLFCGGVIEDGEDFCLVHDPTLEDGYGGDGPA